MFTYRPQHHSSDLLSSSLNSSQRSPPSSTPLSPSLTVKLHFHKTFPTVSAHDQTCISDRTRSKTKPQSSDWDSEIAAERMSQIEAQAKKGARPKGDAASDSTLAYNETTLNEIRPAAYGMKRSREVENDNNNLSVFSRLLDERRVGPTTTGRGRPAKKRSRTKNDAGRSTVVVKPESELSRSVASIEAELESLKDKHEAEAEALKEKHRELEVGLERELGEAVMTEHLNATLDAVADASSALRLANAKMMAIPALKRRYGFPNGRAHDTFNGLLGKMDEFDREIKRSKPIKKKAREPGLTFDVGL